MFVPGKENASLPSFGGEEYPLIGGIPTSRTASNQLVPLSQNFVGRCYS
jgi:hypothetical protein